MNKARTVKKTWENKKAEYKLVGSQLCNIKFIKEELLVLNKVMCYFRDTQRD